MLTQLYNRIEFESHTEEVLSLAKRGGNSFALFFIDVDNFKEINDIHGHEIGDKLLQALSKRWQACLRQSDILGRLGGDEFGLVVPFIRNPTDASRVADKLIKTLHAPFFISGKSISVMISIGIACYPEAADNAQDLLKHADIAMYRAKKTSGSHFEHYTKSLQKEYLHQSRVLKFLSFALDRKEFYLVYRPIIYLQTNQMVGMEVLIRWDNPTMGAIGPEEFIPLAEENGLIVPIGQWVIEKALIQYAGWSKQFKAMGNLNINLSIRQLSAENLVDVVCSRLASLHIDPSKILFELTETAIMTNIDAIRKILKQFGRYGVRFSIDDFGTGYSSMLHLKLLPLSEIKIDRSFTRDIMTDPNDMAIVKSILSLAKSLELQVVAEGIETKEQLNFLIKHGCEKGQGGYFSHPLCVDEMTEYLRKQDRLN